MTNHVVDAERYPQGGIVQKFSAYIVQARENQAPAESLEFALKCILDLLSAVGAGVGQPGALAIRKTAHETRPPGDIPIWFTGETSSVIGAAWANSAAASALDLDDDTPASRGHPGAAVIPTAIAVARETNATFGELLNAIVIGYEVGTAISAARAYGSTGTWAPYAVVAAAAALRRSSREVIEHALAIAGESAPNQSLASAPAPRNPHPAPNHVKEGITWAVATGLESLASAQNGFHGARNILDATRYYNFPGDLSLGSYQYIRTTGFKPYCCCRHLHGALDALIELIKEHRLVAGNIDSIEVETYGPALRISNWQEPRDIMDVQYSHPYCLALVAHYGHEALLPLTGDVLNDPAVTALSHKVELSLSRELDQIYAESGMLPARVTVTCGDQCFVSPITFPKDNGLPWDKLEDKFRQATRFAATPKQQDMVIRAISEARRGDIRGLMESLSEVRLD
ncbi:MmgE/PrpD family protein [Paraburkholderia diazotrophica]|uniref:MmgE/PrpD family protein n=1 Tax=Paraburkholderia diazotrophica TaxID=667676 RepID=UPI00317112F0